jgi:hypothetical protein
MVQQTQQQQEPANPWKAINCTTTEQGLSLDYSTYCKNRLIEYKKADFTPADMQKIEDMAITFTGHNNYKSALYDARDENDNYFPHIAIQKFDLPVLTWLVTQQHTYYPKNKQDKGFAEACIDHLYPHNNISDEKKQIACNMLNAIITNYSHQLNRSLRQPIAEKLILVQIECRKAYKSNIFENIDIKPLLAHGPDKNLEPIKLSALFQQVTDANGNTISHIIAQECSPNTLHKLIRNKWVSPAPNKNGKTVLDIAQLNFQHFTRDPLLINLQTEESSRARCCLFMLLRYIKSKQGETLGEQFTCCDKHIIK